MSEVFLVHYFTCTSVCALSVFHQHSKNPATTSVPLKKVNEYHSSKKQARIK